MAKNVILVEVVEDRMGNVTVTPVNQRVCRQIEKHLAMFGERDCSAFFQEGMGAEQFKEEHLTRAQRSELERGWPLRVKMSTYTFGMLRGWDVSELEINPSKVDNPDYEQFTVAELERMPTLSSGHMHDLKHDDGQLRYWLSRMTVEDGEEYAIYVEELQDGRWVDVHQYGDPQAYEEMYKTTKAKHVRTLKNKLLR